MPDHLPLKQTTRFTTLLKPNWVIVHRMKSNTDLTLTGTLRFTSQTRKTLTNKTAILYNTSPIRSSASPSEKVTLHNPHLLLLSYNAGRNNTASSCAYCTRSTSKNKCAGSSLEHVLEFRMGRASRGWSSQRGVRTQRRQDGRVCDHVHVLRYRSRHREDNDVRRAAGGDWDLGLEMV